MHFQQLRRPTPRGAPRTGCWRIGPTRRPARSDIACRLGRLVRCTPRRPSWSGSTQVGAAGQRVEVEAHALRPHVDQRLVRRPPDGQFPSIGLAEAGTGGHDLIADQTVGLGRGEYGLLDQRRRPRTCPCLLCPERRCAARRDRSRQPPAARPRRQAKPDRRGPPPGFTTLSL